MRQQRATCATSAIESRGELRRERGRLLRRNLALGAISLSVAGTALAADEALVPAAPLSELAAHAPLQIESIVTVLWQRFRVARRESTLIAEAVISSANRYAVSPVLLLAVIATESGFDRHAVSVAGAQGLMQILPAAHPELAAAGKDITEPTENVRIGSSILREYLDASDGDLGSALKRYSGGGRGYAQRVDFRMRQFSASLDAANRGSEKVAVVDSH
ncbi:lytic transglycosylase domain-containing protein [Caballeronia sp.]|jgi:soluble lytic murein transglycosylase-like protein|uniref:lytic transglycosylase domain-containing protein n=1 Tax=Caballeronia sp. TaxID=1931223 RepID=UPI003C66B990